MKWIFLLHDPSRGKVIKIYYYYYFLARNLHCHKRYEDVPFFNIVSTFDILSIVEALNKSDWKNSIVRKNWIISVIFCLSALIIIVGWRLMLHYFHYFPASFRAVDLTFSVGSSCNSLNSVFVLMMYYVLLIAETDD